MTKTTTKTKTQRKCLKNPTYATFLKSWWLTHSKYDDRYVTLVILFMSFTLVRVFRSYIQFYRAECITVSGFFFFCENWIICPKHWFLLCSIYIPRCHHLNQTWHKLMKQQRLISYVLIKVDRRRVSPIKQARPGFHIFVPDCWCESSCALYYGLCQRVGSEGKRRGN